MGGEEMEEVEVITLTDDDGNEVPFALLEVVDVDGKQFAILAPVEQLDAEDPDLDLYAFHYEEVGEDSVDLTPVEDEALLERVFAVAEELLFSDDFEDEDEDEDGDDGFEGGGAEA